MCYICIDYCQYVFKASRRRSRKVSMNVQSRLYQSSIYRLHLHRVVPFSSLTISYVERRRCINTILCMTDSIDICRLINCMKIMMINTVPCRYVYHKTTKHYYRFKAMMEFDFDSFQHYLQGIAGGRKNKTSATAIAVETTTILLHHLQTPMCTIMTIY